MRRSVARWLCVPAFASMCLLYGIGALRASPGVEVAANDLRILRDWVATGRLESHPTDASHLTKPGWVATLRLLLPGAGSSDSENRRFLLLNALLVCGGTGLLGHALSRRCGSAAALAFLVFMAGFLPLRDGCDYVTSEPLAASLGMSALAAVLLSDFRDARWLAAAGVLGGALTPIRPNLGLAMIAIVLLLAASSPGRVSGRALFAGVLGFTAALVLGLGLLRVGGHRSGSPVDTARTLLWGTADYYWRWDVGSWPVGRDQRETARLQLDRVEERWRAFARPWNENRGRSLAWRSLHGLFAAEELPPRWPGSSYSNLDKRVRAWWWLAAAALVSLSIAAASSRGAYAVAGAGIAAICVVQSLVCGADPRLALPFWPLLAACLAAAVAAMRWSSMPAASGVLGFLLIVWQVHRVPDIAGFDFALIRGSGRTLEETIPVSRIPRAARAVHFRLLQDSPFALGFRARVNGAIVLERRAEDPRPFPAFFSAPLSPDRVLESRRSGLRVSVETVGQPGSQAALYFPLSPPILGLVCRVDGRAAVPSGFGGETRGGWPVWLTTD